MAEEQKSIEISYKANISDLKKKLEQLPDITSQEAKKMVSALDRQLKQAERAAKKSTEATKKAMSSTSSAAQRGQKDFQRLASSADHASERLKRVGESSGDIDRGFSGIGLALREVNPQLAGAADGLADTFAVVESLTMGFGALNPIVLAGAAAIGTLTLGYMAYEAEMEKTREIVLAVREAQKLLNDETKSQRDNIADALNKVSAIQDQYRLLTGEITDYEFAINEAGRAAAEALQPNIDAQQEIINQRQKDLDLVQKLFKANQTLGTQAVILSDEETSRLQTLQLQNDSIDNRVVLTERGAKVAGQLAHLEKIIEQDLSRQNVILGGLQDKRVQAVDQARQIAEFQQETAQAASNTVEPIQQIVDLEKERLSLLEDALVFGDDDIKKFSAKKQLEEELFKLRSTELEKEILKIDEKYQKEIEKAQELALISGETESAQAVADELRKQRQEEIAQIGIDAEEKRRAEIEKTNQAIAGSFASSLDQASNMISEFAGENKKAQMQAFAINKSLSLASIVMKTAEAIMAAQSLPPPLNVIQSTTAAAFGVAQAAKVQSQQPTFHMGGMAPDETSARLQKGEGILSAQAVRRIGGEKGLDRIERGEGAEKETIVIIQPFKHFGRFAKELGYKKPKQTGVGAY